MATFAFWIVNPNAILSQRLERLMVRQGWNVTTAPNIRAFLEGISKNSVGMALIDWSCFNGPPPAQTLHAVKSKAGGVSFVLTSVVNLTNDQIIQMLEAGADDYFYHNMHENLLLAKLKAHLRRLLPSFAQALDVLKAPRGDIKLDQSRKEVLIRKTAGKWANVSELTMTEFDLLALFLKRPGMALERNFIIETLWQGEGEPVRPGTVDKHVESLRRKLGKMGSRIRTIYGLGYVYREKE